MDMKRFTEITWQEAVVKWSNGEHVFSWSGHTYYMKDETLHFFLGSESNGGESTAFFNDITKGTWYVKKPFDVRAEMLARPNEWVGAYKDSMGYWHKVGLDLQKMHVTEAAILSDKLPYQVRQRVILSSDLDNCVSIEEVLEEEF